MFNTKLFKKLLEKNFFFQRNDFFQQIFSPIITVSIFFKNADVFELQDFG